jgi:hypothetical protein
LCRRKLNDTESTVGLILSIALQSFVGPWPIFLSLDLYTQSVGLLGRGISLIQGLCLHTEQRHRDIHAMSGFRTTVPVFEREKTVNALDHAVPVIGIGLTHRGIIRVGD